MCPHSIFQHNNKYLVESVFCLYCFDHWPATLQLFVFNFFYRKSTQISPLLHTGWHKVIILSILWQIVGSILCEWSSLVPHTSQFCLIHVLLLSCSLFLSFPLSFLIFFSLPFSSFQRFVPVACWVQPFISRW